jgi:hypothetical protein
LISTDLLPTSNFRPSMLAALKRAGWQIDDVRHDRVEASDGDRYGIGILFEQGVPVELCYGEGELDRQFCEEWTEAPGLLAPEEVARLFDDEKGEQG